jgi:hypothetical protein
MKGKVGVGYRLFNEIFLGVALYAKNTINDYAMLRSKVSEFVYQPILDHVHGLAMRKENVVNIFKKPFWKNNYAKSWCRMYVSTIRKPVNEHRSLMADKFKNRIDYCDLSAFGVSFKQAKPKDFDALQIDYMAQESTGIGRLKQ